VKRALPLFIAALLAVSVSNSAFAQNVLSGTWTIQPGSSPSQIHLELRYEAGNEHRFNDEHDVAIDSVGLRPADLTSPSHPVHFALRRDAGVVDFTGTAGDGVGAGHYTFTPSPSYADAIASRGIERPSVEKQLVATLLDISPAYTDGLIAAGVRPSSFDKLIAFDALRITPQSIKTLRGAFGPLDEQQLITFTALHIEPQFASDMRAAGLTDLSAENYVSLKALHVDAAYIHELSALGYSGLSAGELTELKALHIDGAYIRRVRSHGYTHATVQQLVQLKALKII